MSRRVVTSCDHCGRDIPGTVRVTWKAEAYALAAQGPDGKFLSDVCMGCAGKLLWVGVVRPGYASGGPREDAPPVSTSAGAGALSC